MLISDELSLLSGRKNNGETSMNNGNYINSIKNNSGNTYDTNNGNRGNRKNNGGSYTTFKHGDINWISAIVCLSHNTSD